MDMFHCWGDVRFHPADYRRNNTILRFAQTLSNLITFNPMMLLKPTILTDEDVKDIKIKKKWDFVPFLYFLIGVIISGLLGAFFGYVFLFPN